MTGMVVLTNKDKTSQSAPSWILAMYHDTMRGPSASDTSIIGSVPVRCIALGGVCASCRTGPLAQSQCMHVRYMLISPLLTVFLLSCPPWTPEDARVFVASPTFASADRTTATRTRRARWRAGGKIFFFKKKKSPPTPTHAPPALQHKLAEEARPCLDAGGGFSRTDLCGVYPG
jgi:hypothetical protein